MTDISYSVGNIFPWFRYEDIMDHTPVCRLQKSHRIRYSDIWCRRQGQSQNWMADFDRKLRLKPPWDVSLPGTQPSLGSRLFSPHHAVLPCAFLLDLHHVFHLDECALLAFLASSLRFPSSHSPPKPPLPLQAFMDAILQSRLSLSLTRARWSFPEATDVCWHHRAERYWNVCSVFSYF